jgi:hypothetical protein
MSEMPEIDLKRAKVLGVGEYFRKLAAANRYVQLDPDVARFFKDPRVLNELLRAVMQSAESTRRARKSA